MLAILGGRGSGKTNTLVREMMEDPNGVLVVPTIKERNTLVKYLGVPDERVIVAGHFTGTFPLSIHLYVDRVDTVIGALLKGDVRGVALDTCEVKVL